MAVNPQQSVLPVKRTPVISLALGFVLLFGIVGAVAAFTFSVQRNADNQADLFRASVRIGLLFSTLQDIEASQRGYLLTHNETYLGPYGQGVQALPTRVAALEEVLANRPDQQSDFNQIKALVPPKLDEIKRTIELARAGKIGEAIAIVNGDSGQRIMGQIRDLITRMRQRQTDALQAAADAVADSASRLRIGVGVVAVLVLLLGGYAFAEKRRQRLALEKSAHLLEEHGHALEEANRNLQGEIESRQAAEGQLRQMQKMEAVGQLTGGLAHDFNNMLAVVLSALGLAERRMAKNDFEIRKYLESASDAANRAANLTKRLLAFSRQQALAPEPIDANKMVADMSELLRRTLGEHIQLETVLAGGLWRIHADPSQLENSIVNLAVNARDAMPEGGRITVETGNAHLDDDYASENIGIAAGQYVLIAVTDTGTGMSPEVAARAFDPFFTTKKVGQGTGLGLSQVYGFVRQSGGQIKIYTEVGQGTTVKLYLPRYFAGEAALARPSEPKARLQVGKPRETVLVVEDEERVRALTTDALREIGYTVVAAASAAAALDLLGQHPDVVLVFTDIVMPDMNGRKLAELALARRPDLKVLYTTGFTRNAVVHNGILDPGVNFLAKPFTLEQLAAKVREAIDG